MHSMESVVSIAFEMNGRTECGFRVTMISAAAARMMDTISAKNAGIEVDSDNIDDQLVKSHHRLSLRKKKCSGRQYNAPET
jgi:hypothetical protein